ncbi:MAG: NfeD family protein [Acidobacteria bacterium]|nr:NfeD family protein [Acidobacteriota bacterium]
MSLLWWHWIVIGLLLVVGEMASAGGFYIIFFGVAALLVGILAAFGIAGPVWAQVLLFSILSVSSLAVFRSRLLTWMQLDPQRPAVDPLIGEIGISQEDIVAGGVGRLELRGTAWSARNATSSALPRGTRCRVVRVEGLMLHVEPEGGRV